MKATLAVVAAAGVAGGLAGAAIGTALGGGDGNERDATVRLPAAVEAARPETPHPGRRLTPEQAYRADAPGVVVITATQTEVVPPTLFAPAQRRQVPALGSGLVIDADGDVVTNDHVVHGARNIRVGFTGDVTYPATLVGADPSTDVAVIRVHAPTGALHPLGFGDSSAVQVGDRVYAIGNPFGLDRTMTAGIVSATARDIEAPNGLTIANAIQTDAPINHGRSTPASPPSCGACLRAASSSYASYPTPQLLYDLAVALESSRGVTRARRVSGRLADGSGRAMRAAIGRPPSNVA